MGAYFIIKSSGTAPPAAATEQIVADVAGAVVNPGVYNFTSGQIIEDAIKQAGGLTDQTDLELLARTINRAAELQNHGKIYIPVKGAGSYVAAGSTSTGSTTSAVAGPVNINTASSAELDTLPGIGPVTAGYIIDYRTKKGPFKRIEDLMKISGISAAKYAKLKGLVTV